MQFFAVVASGLIVLYPIVERLLNLVELVQDLLIVLFDFLNNRGVLNLIREVGERVSAVSGSPGLLDQGMEYNNMHVWVMHEGVGVEECLEDSLGAGDDRVRELKGVQHFYFCKWINNFK